MPGDHAQRGGLAAAAGTEQAAIGATRDAQRDRVHREGGAVALGDREQFDVEAIVHQPSLLFPGQRRKHVLLVDHRSSPRRDTKTWRFLNDIQTRRPCRNGSPIKASPIPASESWTAMSGAVSAVEPMRSRLKRCR